LDFTVYVTAEVPMRINPDETNPPKKLARRYYYLSDPEMDVVLNALELNHPPSDTEEETLLEWCGKTRLRIYLLEQLLGGQLQVTGFRGKEPVFRPTEEFRRWLQQPRSDEADPV
jgi:hypothetical protein